MHESEWPADHACVGRTRCVGTSNDLSQFADVYNVSRAELLSHGPAITNLAICGKLLVPFGGVMLAGFEAHLRAFVIHHTGEAAHGSVDAGEEGLYNGYGGGRRQIPQGQYGPAGGTIDTRLPFRVHAFFGTDRRSGHLTGIEVTLQQGDRSLHYPIVSKWRYVDGLTATFEAGLTPVMSYSSAQDMSWLDRPPCPEFTRNDVQAQDRCGEAASFSDFAVCEGNVWCDGLWLLTKATEGPND